MIFVRGHINSWTGFGRLACEVGIGLAKRGLEIGFDARVFDEKNAPVPFEVKSRINAPPPGCHILSADGLMFADHRHETNPISVFTMWEVSGVPPRLVDCLNRTRLIIVPTRFCADVFSAAGAKPPIEICPLGIDMDDFVGSDKYPSGGPIKFGCSGWVSNSYFRKGLDDVIAAFRRAFDIENDNVRLEVKCWPGCVVRGHEGDPRITIRREQFDRHQLVQWYRSLHCFVSASRGEGWGLCSHEALAAGRPVIGTNWSGQGDVLSYDTGILIPYSLECPTDRAYQRIGRWAVPDRSALADAMQAVASDPIEVRRSAQSGIERARSLTWSKTADAVYQILCKHGVA